MVIFSVNLPIIVQEPNRSLQTSNSVTLTSLQIRTCLSQVWQSEKTYMLLSDFAQVEISQQLFGLQNTHLNQYMTDVFLPPFLNCIILSCLGLSERHQNLSLQTSNSGTLTSLQIRTLDILQCATYGKEFSVTQPILVRIKIFIA